MAVISLDWEQELWHYVSTGDGISCPIYQNCTYRLQSGQCSCKMFNFARDGLSLKTLCCFADGTAPCGGCASQGYQCEFTSQLSHESFRPGRIFDLLQNLSENWLDKGGILEPPVPLNLISMMDTSCPVEIRTIPMKAYSGAIWRTNDGWVIYLNSNENPDEQRLAAFHEAFHLLAHCKATPTFKKRGSEKGAFNELLADNFALHILMPRRWVEERWEKDHDTALLAEQFRVTEATVMDRLKSLRLT